VADAAKGQLLASVALAATPERVFKAIASSEITSRGSIHSLSTLYVETSPRAHVSSL
jgi:hypothetical protein